LIWLLVSGVLLFCHWRLRQWGGWLYKPDQFAV
jgi:hypothetical protein